MLAYTVNYLDRQILAILLEPIKRELQLSDTQLGVLSGITFALFYATLAVPIAMWADRGNRRNIIALSLTLFSGMTVLCGFASTYIHLVLARIGVGIGEAGTSPPAHSIISDLFPPSTRATAIAFYTLGFNFGVLLGFLIGGWVAQWYGWRAAFIIVGIPGLFIALLVRFTLREPIRGHIEGATASEAEKAPGLAEVGRFLWTQRSFRHIAFGAIPYSLGGYVLVVWLPGFLSRSFHMTSGEIGTWLALIIGFVGGAGTYLSGYLVNRLSRRDVRWTVWLISIFALINFPFSVAMYLADSAAIMLTLFLYPAMAMAGFMAPAFSMTQSLVPVRMRAQASAILFCVMNIVGLGLGPPIVGILSDAYAPSFGAESLRYALMTMAGLWLLSALHFFKAAKTLPADIQRATSLPATSAA